MLNLARRPTRRDAREFPLLLGDLPGTPHGAELASEPPYRLAGALLALFEAGELVPDELARLLAPIWRSDPAHTGTDGLDHDQWQTLWRAAADESGFTYNGYRFPRPRLPLKLYRSAETERREGLSWTASLQIAAGLNAYQRGYGRSQTNVWQCRIPPNRIYGYVHFEDEFLCDVAGLTIQPADELELARARPTEARLFTVNNRGRGWHEQRPCPYGGALVRLGPAEVATWRRTRGR